MSRPTPGLDRLGRAAYEPAPAGRGTGDGPASAPEDALPAPVGAARGAGAGGDAGAPRSSRRPGLALAAAAAGLALLAIAVGRIGDEPVTQAVAPPTAESAPVAPPESGGPRSTADSVSTAPREVLIPQRASGTMRALPLPGADSPRAGREVRYTVEIEDGLRVDEAEYARTVREVLTDRRGWETQDGVRFVHVAPTRSGPGRGVDVHITLASPDTVDRLCAPLDTNGELSCQNGDRVVLNAVRWTQGVDDYAGQLPQYRRYLVNHEVGHALGHGHAACPGRGRPAPVMLQQSLGLDGCTRYPWPVPGQPL